MRKSTCMHFFEKYIYEVSNGRGYREHINPAVQFTKDAKAGKYDQLSDEEYSVRLHDVEDIAAFWLNRPEQKASDILRVALENIDIDKESLHKIAELLSKCYFSSKAPISLGRPVQEPEASKENLESKSSEGDFEPESSEGNFNPESPGEDYEPADFFFDELPESEYGAPSRKKYLEQNSTADAILTSPKKIYEQLTKHIYGQEDAVRAAAMLLYNHEQGRKRNVLFIGQTGSGKTEIWRVCKQLNPNIRIIDSTLVTEEGWTGAFKAKNIFDNMSRQEAESAIIVFDEFDKLCEPKIGSGGTNHSLGIQNGLLKMIEGTTIQLKDFDIDTSKISFVFCGSFERLTEMKTDVEAETSIGFGSSLEKKEAQLVYKDALQPSDLVKYAGMRQEIAGRINQIVQLSPMTAGDYKNILKNDQISPLRQLERQYGVKLHLDRDTEQKLAQEAAETHMGVRYLRSRIQQMLDEQMFRDCGRTEYTLSA